MGEVLKSDGEALKGNGEALKSNEKFERAMGILMLKDNGDTSVLMYLHNVKIIYLDVRHIAIEN